jgi:5'-methylthioinosine phosphorylase
MMNLALGVIGGTGLYQFEGLQDINRVAVATPYGAPSGEVVCGTVNGACIAFIARHGEAHTIAPHRVNYRANVWAMHHLGARRVIGVNAVGGIAAHYGPCVIGVPDQIIDYTHGRLTSFCDVDNAPVDHIDLSEPYTDSLRQYLLKVGRDNAIELIDGGVYGATQGPRLETRAEIKRMQRDGCDLVGMTGMPEAALARELKLDYACIALVANWAAGCGDEVEISLDEIYANLKQCTTKVPLLIRALLA